MSKIILTENDLPTGYTHSQVGIIPTDWTVERIGNISEIFGRIGFRGYTKKDIVSSDQGVLSISPSNMKNGRLILDSGTYITWEKYFESPEIQIQNEDILLVKTGSTFGKVAYVKGLKEPATLNPQVVVLKKLKVPSEFLIHLMMSEIIQNQINDTIVGGAIPTLSQKAVANYLFAMPTPREQVLIGKALTEMDTLIDELNRLIKKKQAIKTATMQQLLTGKTRLPEFALREDGTPKAYKNSELGQIPEDWDVYKVGEISDVLTGFPFPSSHYTDSGVRLLRGSNVKRGVTDWSEDITQYWPIISSDIKKYELKVGDIVISMDGSLVGRSFAQLDKSDLPAVLLQRVARVRSSDVDQNYLKQWICSEMFTAHCDAVKTVTAIPHISPDDIKTFRFVAPKCKKEQKQLSGILKDMEVEIQILNEKLTKLIMFKKGMMQELLTGKTRLV